ncbi:ATP-binding domain-containing protein [Frankia sp. Cr2]|uniref:HelD family protein n=1 Tax=Frankia sp. Cr2 TaxID=3073932 RepID=UPI003A103900
MLYGRLDDIREETSNQLARAWREAGGNHQARGERDAASLMYARRIAQVDAAANGLCFGRLDLHDAECRYIGRMGILDETTDYTPLLIDWRAPVARPFYLATAVSPQGVRRRRHIRTRQRTVVGLTDDLFDLNEVRDAEAMGAAGSTGDTVHQGLTGEATLLAALDAERTGRMRDIVETIQGEQDRIIRSDHQGVLVVQGGPGTGKSAVALHRAAYLLYTYRERLSKQVVLIVGPNPTFIRYIGQVLPSLGETGVLLSTIGDLYPGISASRTEAPETAEVKGRLMMAEILAAAVRDRQRVPDDVIEIVVDHHPLRLDRQTCLRARERARRSGLLHNAARPIFARLVVDAFARQLADLLGLDVHDGTNLFDEAEVDDIRKELRGNLDVAAVVEELWPTLTPQRLLRDLFSMPGRLARAAPGLTDADRDLLARDAGTDPGADRNDGWSDGWSVADIPLLDEAAELLGEDDRVARALAEQQRRAERAYAQGVLDILSRDLEDDADPDMLTAYDLLDAAQLAARHAEVDGRLAAERAAADRTWTFGHVIVDEAQELSEMAWRMLMRRCPSRSMTVVGDVAQTGELAGTSSWEHMLTPYVAGWWRLEQLTVNYRTPVEIMTVAAEVLADIDPSLEPPRSVRESGIAPWRLQVSADGLADGLAQIVAQEAGELGGGRLAVIVPVARLDELGPAVRIAVPAAAVATDAVGTNTDLENPVVVLTVRQAKGLEFDVVLVADPHMIVAESPRGHSDLYVALTRATRRLGVIHIGAPPPALNRLTPRTPPAPPVAL